MTVRRLTANDLELIQCGVLIDEDAASALVGFPADVIEIAVRFGNLPGTRSGARTLVHRLDVWRWALERIEREREDAQKHGRDPIMLD